ncbi:MAG: hypothetical protein ACI94Y_001498 [Maribacter sp.]|jgi:hypothetical protein
MPIGSYSFEEQYSRHHYEYSACIKSIRDDVQLDAK